MGAVIIPVIVIAICDMIIIMTTQWDTSDAPNGNIVPGIKREIMVAEIISKYLRFNNVVGKFEYFLDCLKIWDKENFLEAIETPEYDGPFEELELVYTSFEVFQAVISRHLQVIKSAKPDTSRQGYPQEFGIWLMNVGLLL